MVKIIIYKNEDVIVGVKSQGHSGFAESGQDIVCAAVSILMINTINSIEEFTDDGFSYGADEENALIDIKLEEEYGRDSVLLLRSLVLGLEAVASEYGKKYVRIRYKEV